jgi:hypothetical protein
MNLVNLRFFVLFAFMIIGLQSNSQIHEGPAQTSNVPIITRSPGMPFLAIWPDGREAVLVVVHADSPMVDSSFKIADNECSNRQNMICRYHFVVRRFWSAMVWSKHPDTKKINQIVERAYSNSSPFEKLEDEASISTAMSQVPALKMNAGLPAHEISCADWSWLPGELKAPPAKLSLSRWDAEEAFGNPETRLTENRTIGGLYGVELVRSSTNRLRVVRVASLTGLAAQFDIPMLFPTVGMTALLADGNSCQVGLNTNLRAEFIPIYEKMRTIQPPYVASLPYIIGTDEFLSTLSVKVAIQRWFTLSTLELFR